MHAVKRHVEYRRHLPLLQHRHLHHHVDGCKRIERDRGDVLLASRRVHGLHGLHERRRRCGADRLMLRPPLLQRRRLLQRELTLQLLQRRPHRVLRRGDLRGLRSALLPGPHHRPLHRPDPRILVPSLEPARHSAVGAGGAGSCHRGADEPVQFPHSDAVAIGPGTVCGAGGRCAGGSGVGVLGEPECPILHPAETDGE